jgi:hypothetical protein
VPAGLETCDTADLEVRATPWRFRIPQPTFVQEHLDFGSRCAGADFRSSPAIARAPPGARTTAALKEVAAKSTSVGDSCRSRTGPHPHPEPLVGCHDFGAQRSGERRRQCVDSGNSGNLSRTLAKPESLRRLRVLPSPSRPPACAVNAQLKGRDEARPLFKPLPLEARYGPVLCAR